MADLKARESSKRVSFLLPKTQIVFHIGRSLVIAYDRSLVLGCEGLGSISWISGPATRTAAYYRRFGFLVAAFPLVLHILFGRRGAVRCLLVYLQPAQMAELVYSRLGFDCLCDLFFCSGQRGDECLVWSLL